MHKKPAEADSIFAWLVNGAIKYYQSGLAEPQAVRQATDEYRAEMDILSGFIGECLVNADENESVRASMIYEVYEKWNKQNGATNLTQNAFGKHLSEKGFNKKRSMISNIYSGIQLSEYGDSFVYRPNNPF